MSIEEYEGEAGDFNFEGRTLIREWGELKRRINDDEKMRIFSKGLKVLK